MRCGRDSVVQQRSVCVSNFWMGQPKSRDVIFVDDSVGDGDEEVRSDIAQRRHDSNAHDIATERPQSCSRSTRKC